MNDPNWREEALCAKKIFLTPEELSELDDPEERRIANTRKAHSIFFSGKGNTAAIKESQEICDKCTVQLDCLAYSLKSKQSYGTWGGVSGRAKRRIRQMQGHIARARLFEDPEYLAEVEKVKDSEWKEVWGSEVYITGLGLED